MGDSEKVITYTPEELAEISRIVESISIAGGSPEMPPPPQPSQPVSEPGEASFDEYIGEPEDLDLPAGDFEGLVAEEKGPEVEEFPEEELTLPEEESGIGESLDFEEEKIALDTEDFSEADLTLDESDLADISSEDLQDITDFVQVEEEPAGEIAPPEAKPSARKKPESPLDQLEALTSEEPESLDMSDISDEQFVDEGIREVEPVEAGAADEELAELGEELQFEEEAAELMEKPGEVSLEKDIEVEIPDLADISLDEVDSIPEAAEEDIPDIDLGDLSEEKAAVSDAEGIAGEDELLDTGFDELGAEDLVDLGNIEDVSAEKISATTVQEPEVEAPDLGISEEDLDEIDRIDIGDIEAPERETKGGEEFTIEPLEEEVGMAPPPREVAAEEPLELTEKELKRLKKAILLFNAGLIKAIKDVIVNDLLSPKDTRALVDLILSGKAEDTVHRFLEKKLNRKIERREEGPSGRRVLYARAEYTKEGRERQRRLFKVTKIFGAAAVVAFIITILSYQYLYKPYMAKKLITQGVALIRERGDYKKKPGDYRKAEEIFRDVNENYRENYLPGYTSYGRAYFDVKEYSPALQKFNKAFSINPADIDTLNGLGYFYSRVPDEYYRLIKDNINNWYYKGKKKEMAEKSQLDVAINFYRMVLQRDSENITALFGIGNAYYHQGQYLRAKKYYEDILKADPDSAVGYAGLLNLYIDRDSFAQAATLHARIKDKDMMPELPSALLGKLAEYYLSKKRTDDSSIRIDYGVQSPRIKDEDDNPYPAVISVLNDLVRRDPDYPPLQVHWARLNRAQKNYTVMEKYLDRALDLSPNYFGALHLLGEYYYFTNEPVKAYEYLNRAVNSYKNQPEFTLDDFYRETEDIGKTYAFLGNIFYYFFDKLKYRYGSLEDELIEDNTDRFLNYSIAREKYEEAVNLGFSSPEIRYNLGRIYYMAKLYREALDQWLNLYEEFVTKPELMFALGNAFYHLGNYEAGKGEYLKLVDAFEMDAESITVVQKSNSEHIRIFRTLSAAYNNLGAVYQIQNNESKSGICYWKSIDYAKRLDQENEFARINMARSFNRETKSAPILDEEVPFSIDVYREDLR
ncbi:MAG TPA: tetratricopeptide repeat protein [Spirochaetota bacterium]|nr:tetratricopeptide repeat protein [Spirochaetota bacterium]HPI89523.1 tetratricopeptide repeat protein [Spirochaetota bacterium]HPR47111.1 tetratricopeptide repeat protein [Spirochaetota bacterium]